MYLNSHGGKCCGITHMYGCDGSDANFITIEAMARRLEEVKRYTDHPSCILKEIVLTNYQMRVYPEVVAAMKKAGFVRVARWKNSNSGNICNMFLLYVEPSSKPVPY